MSKTSRELSPSKNEKVKKSTIDNIYEKIMHKFDSQSIKIKASYSNQTFDDQSIAKKRKILPTLEVASPRAAKRKFYSNKVILNQSIYVNERKESSYHDMMTDFKKLSIPSPYQNEGVLSQRNRRIKELYERAEKKVDNPENKIKFTSPIDNPHKIKDLEMIIQPIREIKIPKGDKSMKDILKQAKQRREKLELPHLRAQRTKSSIVISESSLEKNNQEIVKGNTIKAHTPLRHQKHRKLQKIDGQQNSLLEKQKPKTFSHKKILNESPYKQITKFKSIAFNWKKQVLPLNKISKQAFVNLIRFYLNIGEVNPIHSGYYRAYVGSGNNGALIKKTLKERGHWTFVQSLSENPHFVWTQLNQKQFSTKLINSKMLESQDTLLSTQLSTFTEMKSENLSTQNNELTQFLKLKRNDFTMGCEKLFEKECFEKMMNDLMKKFKRNENVKYYNRLRPETIRHYYKGRKQIQIETVEAGECSLNNHIENAGCIGDKKGLLYILKKYSQVFDEDVSEIIPTTIHLEQSQNCEIVFESIPNGPWILKPGESTNRGTGITTHTCKETLIAELSKKKKHRNGAKFTNIVQKYIEPLLYFNRKFDIRIWVLWNGRHAWWYQEGYIRTASKEYSLKNTNKYIHLTNDAIQCQCQDYGKYEPANKVSFNQLHKYLESNYHYKNFFTAILPTMKQLALKTFRMSNLLLNPMNSKHCFELFGLDYLIDNEFRPWLIECNTNPCLEINCSLLARLVPNLINNVLSLTADVIFPPPAKKKLKDEHWSQEGFKFELMFDGEQDLDLRERLLISKVKVEYHKEFQQQFDDE